MTKLYHQFALQLKHLTDSIVFDRAVENHNNNHCSGSEPFVEPVLLRKSTSTLKAPFQTYLAKEV